MPGQIKDVDRFPQRACHQHAELFDDMRLGIEWRKTEKQRQRDEQTVVEQIFHEEPAPRRQCGSLPDSGCRSRPKWSDTLNYTAWAVHFVLRPSGAVIAMMVVLMLCGAPVRAEQAGKKTERMSLMCLSITL